MTPTLAYQIGAVFLFAALLMAGSRAKSLLGLQTLRTVRTTVLIAGALLLGMAGYHSLPDIIARVMPSKETPAGAAPVSATPVATPVRKAAPKDAGKQYILYSAPVGPAPLAAPVPVEEAPVPVVEETSENVRGESGHKGKRALKAVGHFLHIGKKQP